MKYVFTTLFVIAFCFLTQAQSTWSKCVTGLPSNFIPIAVAGNSSEIFLNGASSNISKLYKSTTGDDWTEVTTTGLSGHAIHGEIEWTGSRFLMAASKASLNYDCGIYASVNGEDWTLSDQGMEDSFSVRYMAVSAGNIYASGRNLRNNKAGLFASYNNGDSWARIPVSGLGNDPDFSAMAHTGTKLLVWNDKSGEIFSSTTGYNWSLSNTGIDTDFVAVDFVVISSMDILAIGIGKNNASTMFRSVNGGSNWSKFEPIGMESYGAGYQCGARAGNQLFIGVISLNNKYSLFRSELLVTDVPETPGNSFLVYPNPATEILQVKCSEQGNTNITVLDMLGRVLYTHQYNTINCAIPVKELQPGRYLLKVQNEKGTGTKVFVKE